MVVALGGYYGFKNAGDEAMLLALAEEIKSRGHWPLVLSATPAESEEAYNVPSLNRYNPLTLLRAVLRSDLLVLGGGGLFQDKTSKKSLLYYVGLLRLARLFRRPAAAFGVSLGPLSAWGERVISRALRDVWLVVRDKKSFKYAERLGLSPELGGDPALLLKPPEVAREPGLVVVIPRWGVPTKPLVDVAWALEKSGRQVLVLGLEPARDAEVLEDFKGLARELTGDPKRALFLIGSAEYVVSARLHGAVFAAVTKTPFAALNYDPKVEGFVTDAGAPLLSLSPKPEEVLDLVEKGVGPDWQKVEEMRFRVRRALARLLPTPAPAGDA